VDCNHYFLEAKIGQTGYSGLNNKFCVCVIFYDHLSDFLQPDFRFGIFLSLIATISWALVVCIRRKAATFNPYFSLGLQMVISSSFLIITERLAPLSTSPAFRQYHGGRLLI
jgi:drug/metabolite transporter (DMT)-like permease